jgi:hypothetical protein
MTEYQLQAMSRTGETGELPLRNAAPGSSGRGSAEAIDEVRFVEIASRHLPGDMDPHNAWLFFQEASRAFFGREIA